jgi:predicted site-specific integrase-resolvase
MTVTNLTPKELAKRWGLPLSTLSQWRWNGHGPTFVKLGKRVSYRVRDVENFEEEKLRRDTTCIGSQVACKESKQRKENEMNNRQ